MSVFAYLSAIAAFVLLALLLMALDEIKRLSRMIAQVQHDNDQIHELVEHYRTLNNDLILDAPEHQP